MSKTKIKRSLFIGAGGTGMDTILSTKKFYVDTYGKVPPMVAFLGLDTDQGYYNRKQKTRIGTEIGLTTGEIYQLTVDNPSSIYRANKNFFSWMPQVNEQYLRTLVNGAGQVRSNGRFAISYRTNDLKTAIESKLTAITNAEIAANAEFDVADGKIYIHVIFSISGGTGCGTFIDLLYRLRDVCNSKFGQNGYSIFTYAVLPEVFKTMRPGSPDMANVEPNAYGALLDVDYLANLNGSRAFTFKYPDGSSIDVTNFPIDWMTLISNRNDQQDSYTHVSQLTEMLSLSLVTLSGDYGQAAASPLDNIASKLMVFDVEDKKAWVCGMGMSEILFDSDLMALFCSLKASRALISKLTSVSHDKDFDKEVMSWINLPDVDICEHEKDPVIDFIMSKNPKRPYDENYIDDMGILRSDIDKYLETDAMPRPDEIKGKIAEKTKAVGSSLHNRIVSMVNEEYGIGDAKKFLSELRLQIDIYKTEMSTESNEFKEKLNFAEKNVDSNCRNLEEADGLSVLNFRRKARIQEAKEALIESVNALAVMRREIKRREAALQIYHSIDETINKEYNKVESLAKSLESLDAQYARREKEIQSKSGGEQIFVVPLHKDSFGDVKVENTDYSVIEFKKMLNLEEGIYSIVDKTNEEIGKLIREYCDKLPVTEKWRGMGVEEVLRAMPVQKYNETIQLAMRRSAPLITFDYHGAIPKPLNEIFIVGTPEKEVSVINEVSPEDIPYNERRKSLKDALKSHQTAETVSTGARDRILVYRLVSAIPPFVLSGMDNYKRLYEQTKNVNFHIDNNIERAMKMDGYSMFPAKDDKDIMDLWVKGIILKRINNINGIYYLTTNVKELKGLTGKYQLNERSNRRDTAFENFKNVLGLVKEELSEYISSTFADMGTTKVQELYREVQQENPDDVYYDKYSQVNLKKSTLTDGGPTYEPIYNLIIREKEHVATLI